MCVFVDFTVRVRGAVLGLWPVAPSGRALDLSSVLVEAPREPCHGDLSTNAAMVLAEPLLLEPLYIADKIAAVLMKDNDLTSVSVAGPGFINMTLSSTYFAQLIVEILSAGKDYGRCAPQNVKINIESVSANPTGPLHLGHCRGAVFADALANLLEFVGYDVTREYYINDAGIQVKFLLESAYLRYLEALGEEVEIHSGLYSGDYLKPIGESLVAKFGSSLKSMSCEEWTGLIEQIVIDEIMLIIREDLLNLGVKHDVFFSERALQSGAEGDRVADVIGKLSLNGDVYQGRLPPPKGAKQLSDLEDRDQVIFRSTAYGDDVDRSLIKADGSYTYFASDVAYHYDKYLRGFTRQVDVLGADHGGYVKRLCAAVKAVSGGEAILDVKICQLVKLLIDGKPFKMSKRFGNFVTCRELLSEVGLDAIRFMMLFRKNDTPMDFDLHKVVEQSRDNPVFYVQYAYARSMSVLRQFAEFECDIGTATELAHPEEIYEAIPEKLLVNTDYVILIDSGEISLIRRLMEWPKVVQTAGQAGEPHRIATYLHRLASDFHVHWNRGRTHGELRFVIANDRNITMARLGLVSSVAIVLSNGLRILGVSAPASMR